MFVVTDDDKSVFAVCVADVDRLLASTWTQCMQIALGEAVNTADIH